MIKWIANETNADTVRIRVVVRITSFTLATVRSNYNNNNIPSNGIDDTSGMIWVFQLPFLGKSFDSMRITY